MKLSGARIDAFLKKPDPSVRAVLIYGPDAGLVSERAKLLQKSILPENDPFRLSELPASVLKDDPARLADEAAALSLTGGRRVVRIYGAGDGGAEVFRSFLKNLLGDSLVIVEAGELSKSSSLRRLFEESDAAQAIACYLDDAESLRGFLQAALKERSLGVESDALEYLMQNLGGDRLVSRSEIEKLILYMSDGASGAKVRLEDAQACVGDSAALTLEDLSLAVASGDVPEAERRYDRALREGNMPIVMLRAALRHFQRLHLARAAMDKGQSAKQAMAGLKPPVFFKLEARFASQLDLWNAARIGDAFDLLLETEVACKSTGNTAESVCGQAFLKLARAAAMVRAKRKRA